MSPVVALKIDVDTERGTREGVPALISLLEKHAAGATFLFSMGPDHTGKAISRVFRPGFFQKVSRTSVIQMYGIRTLLNGTVLPAPHIGQRHPQVMQQAKAAGFETGIHCYDHFKWQDHLGRMSLEETRAEFGRAKYEYQRVFEEAALTAGAPGWQANANSREVYDESQLLYSSDSRGIQPYYPRIGNRVFKTLEIPTTLPTLDELLGRPEFPDKAIVGHYLSLLKKDRPNILTLHAEIEGMMKRPLFIELLTAFTQEGVRFVRMDDLANEILAAPKLPPVCSMVMAAIEGRSGTVATQGPPDVVAG